MGSGSSNLETVQEATKETETGNKSDKDSVEEQRQDVSNSPSDQEVNRTEDETKTTQDDATDGDDGWSIDSHNSDDTLGLFSRMRHFNITEDDSDDSADAIQDEENKESGVDDKGNKVNGHAAADKDNEDSDGTDVENNDEVYDNELIAMIAKENLDAYALVETIVCPADDEHVENGKESQRTERSESDDDQSSDEASPKLNSNDPEVYDAGTIGYYISVANNDAKSLNGNDQSKEHSANKNFVDEYIDAKLLSDDRTTKTGGDKSPTQYDAKKQSQENFDEFKRIYGTKLKSQPRKVRVSNRQTLILVRVGNQFKYAAVPAYLPGQKVYKPNSLVKNYMHRSAYKPPYTKAINFEHLQINRGHGVELSDMEPTNKELRKAKLLKKRNELRKANPAKMDALRQKFVDQAKKYFGYPYARKYWPPDSPEYKSKLFLDCCGLVRQVMRDLTYDFGFVIGPWNQAYMYDTLPKTVKEEDMKPGDLVFISATYYNPKSKKQRHNMTHVEIWLGDGPKTIGARWNNGKVQVFDNYRFTAKSYHSETYHFKSIDTWLKGICDSFCSDHRWKRRKYNPSKKSIFHVESDQSLQEQQDEPAGDDGNDENFLVRGNTFATPSTSSHAGTTSGSKIGPSREFLEAKYDDGLDEAVDEGGDSDDDDDEMCDASPGSEDEEVATSNTDQARGDRLDGRGKGLAQKDVDKKSGVKVSIEGSEASFSVLGTSTEKDASLPSKSLSVDLSNRGLYMQDRVGQCQGQGQGQAEANTETESRETEMSCQGGHGEGTACGTSICNRKLDTKLGENDNDKTEAKNSKETKDKMKQDDVEKENKDQQSSSTNETVNEGVVSGFKYLTVAGAAAANINNNALPKSKDEKDKENSQEKFGARPKTYTNKTSSQDASQQQQPQQQAGAPGHVTSGHVTSAGSQDDEAAGSQADMGTVSDISLAGSECSDKGIDTDTNPSEVADADNAGAGSDSGRKKGGGGKKSPGGPKVTKLPACSLPTNMTPTFYVGGGNGVSLVEGPLTSLGWKRTTDKYDERFKLKWVECKSKINYGNFREGEQLVNHLPNSHLLTNKLGLLNSLKEYERVTLSTKGRLPRLKMSEFHPETYKLDEKSDRELFLEVYKESEIWICKPVGMNQGKGIFLIRSREAINQVLEEREQKKQAQQKPGRPLASRIVQRYIVNLLLLDGQKFDVRAYMLVASYIVNPLLLDGRKFDVRAYMLVASSVPFLILYHKGYVRLTCTKYDENDLNLGVHLTNQFVQKKDPAYKNVKEDTAWSMDKFNQYVNDTIRPESHVEIEEDWVYNTFTKQMQKIMIHCFNSVKHKLQQRIGFFDLFGLDFMVDTDMKAWLLEINVNPSLSRKVRCTKEILPKLIAESLFVSIECFEKSRKNMPLMPLQSLKHFTILYCGTRPNTIIPRQSRSVSPVKDTTERPKYVPTGFLQRPSVQRASTQSTPLYTGSSHRRSSEKTDSSNHTASGTKEEVSKSAQTSKSSGTSAGTVKKFTAAKTKPVEETPSKKSDAEAGKSGGSDGKGVGEKKESNKDGESSAKDSSNKDNKESEEEEQAVKVEPAAKAKVSVVDTLTKTTDSLKEATSALGRLSVSLNQVGIAESLLEEVRLKMTHAENSNSGAKPNSAATSTRERENLERGN